MAIAITYGSRFRLRKVSRIWQNIFPIVRRPIFRITSRIEIVSRQIGRFSKLIGIITSKVLRFGYTLAATKSSEIAATHSAAAKTATAATKAAATSEAAATAAAEHLTYFTKTKSRRVDIVSTSQ